MFLILILQHVMVQLVRKGAVLVGEATMFFYSVIISHVIMLFFVHERKSTREARSEEKNTVA